MAKSDRTREFRWRFHRLGGFDQVRIETGADVCHLAELDQKLRATLSCPTTGLELDAHTLTLLDTDEDGRIRELCIQVKDVDAHSAMASLSGTYLAYCHCVRRGGTETMSIVAAFTGGHAENLVIGRNGIFDDRQGRD
ncbi:hypothetical protein THIOKS12340031 [Thiocapsa sp. KS1]|nr:hypothetical protein THIOKS12340031 [Thiocapsa sp. KS1]